MWNTLSPIKTWWIFWYDCAADLNSWPPCLWPDTLPLGQWISFRPSSNQRHVFVNSRVFWREIDFFLKRQEKKHQIEIKSEGCMVAQWSALSPDSRKALVQILALCSLHVLLVHVCFFSRHSSHSKNTLHSLIDSNKWPLGVNVLLCMIVWLCDRLATCLGWS